MARKKDKKTKEKRPVSIKNRKARFDYYIEDSFEVGIVLQGTEVKSIREGNASFTDTFAYIHHGEIWLKDLYIKEFNQGSYNNHDPRRDRKLLLKKDEIRKIDRAINQKGYTLVPLKLYFARGNAKIELALGRGKKQFDKRASIAEKDLKRDMDRNIKGKYKV
ncbi:MAG: SsrA-binding protein SmpB [Balneolales bacterium]